MLGNVKLGILDLDRLMQPMSSMTIRVFLASFSDLVLKTSPLLLSELRYSTEAFCCSPSELVYN